MLKIIQKRKIFFLFSSLLIIAGLFGLFSWGLKTGIDFTGGALLEVNFHSQRPTAADIRNFLEGEKIINGDVRVQLAGAEEIIIRTKTLSNDEHQALLMALRTKYGAENITENRFESIGPVVGVELKNKAIMAIFISLVVIIAYIAYAFRKVSRPVPSWIYGLAATIALAHDVIIVIGIFIFLGKFAGVEIDILFVTAMLTVLGYSVNDTIVVFDRVRENLIYRPKENFELTVNAAVNETMMRSINTTLTTLLVLFSLYFFGGVNIKNFVLALICGIFFGAYSSIFIASPLLVVWQKKFRKSA